MDELDDRDLAQLIEFLTRRIEYFESRGDTPYSEVLRMRRLIDKLERMRMLQAR